MRSARVAPPPHAEAVTRALTAPPRIPSDFDLFSSNVLFGEPGIYPQGSPMVPAAGDAPTVAEAVSALGDLGIEGALPGSTTTRSWRASPTPGCRRGCLR